MKNDSTKKYKIVKLIIVIIFLLLVAGIWKTALTQTQWKTYTNTLLGYSIMYPPNWEIHSIYPDDKYDDGSKVNLSETPYISISSKDMDMSISLKEEAHKSETKSLEESANYWRQYYLGSSAEVGDRYVTEIIKVEDYRIDGITAIKNNISFQTKDGKQQTTGVWMYLPLSDSILSVKYYLNNPKDNGLGLYDEIISTFKFANPITE